MSQPDAWRMIRRRAGRLPHFRATRITAYLADGDALEHAQQMAAHESPRTTKFYDRTKERLTQDEVEGSGGKHLRRRPRPAVDAGCRLACEGTSDEPDVVG